MQRLIVIPANSLVLALAIFSCYAQADIVNHARVTVNGNPSFFSTNSFRENAGELSASAYFFGRLDRPMQTYDVVSDVRATVKSGDYRRFMKIHAHASAPPLGTQGGHLARSYATWGDILYIDRTLNPDLVQMRLNVTGNLDLEGGIPVETFANFQFLHHNYLIQPQDLDFHISFLHDRLPLQSNFTMQANLGQVDGTNTSFDFRGPTNSIWTFDPRSGEFGAQFDIVLDTRLDDGGFLLGLQTWSIVRSNGSSATADFFNSIGVVDIMDEHGKSIDDNLISFASGRVYSNVPEPSCALLLVILSVITCGYSARRRP